ncbi:hypothetical protein EJ02DRAFT_262874 [Clathrospora elynae]|uniref:Uncharacterized protein n=1 Tax=Clathrospora elynae TaxID=706981 RepID=A0A6A5T2K5_9PLEO|nr:hypothetical protein EJ02DRAFT_262874 [Clathrospora elynae]
MALLREVSLIAAQMIMRHACEILQQLALLGILYAKRIYSTHYGIINRPWVYATHESRPRFKVSSFTPTQLSFPPGYSTTVPVIPYLQRYQIPATRQQSRTRHDSTLLLWNLDAILSSPQYLTSQPGRIMQLCSAAGKVSRASVFTRLVQPVLRMHSTRSHNMHQKKQ